MKKLFVQCICIVLCASFFVPSLVLAQQLYNQTLMPGAPTPTSGSYNVAEATTAGSDWSVAGLLGLDKVAEGFNTVLKTVFLTSIYWATRAVSWIVGLTGFLFDELILQLTPTSDDASKIKINAVVNVAWTLIRDVASIILIFSLLYLGIKTILQGQGFADTKVLISIIVAAILLNFSLILTKDIAFYVSNRVGQEILQTAKISDTFENSFTKSIFKMVSPQKLFTKDGGWTVDDRVVESGWGVVFSMAFQAILLVFVLLGMMIIFGALIGQLLIRFIVFIVLIITSPLGIIARTIPWLNGVGKTWWEELKKQTIFFPAFVLTMYIVFSIISALAGIENALQIGDISKDFVNTMGAFFINYLLIIGFLMVLLVLPAKLSSGGSSLVNDLSNWTTKKAKTFVGGATFGGVAMAGRYTLGRRASNVLQDKKLQEVAQNKKGIRGSIARSRLRMADKAQNFSFDVRGTKAGGKFAKKYGLGDAVKGWKGTIDDKKDAYKKQMEKEKKLFGYGKMDDTQKEAHAQKLAQAKSERDNTAKKAQEAKKKLDEAKKKETEIKARGGSLTDAQIADLEKFSKEVVSEEKKLERQEIEVGKLINIGDSSYLEFLKRQRHSGLNLHRRMSRTQKKALEALKKDLEEEYKKLGKAKPVKESKPKTPNVTVGTITGASLGSGGSGGGGTGSGGP